MITQGTYSETLPCGGELKVSSNGWSIEYYFPGLDGRYNGTSVSIKGSQAKEYIQAFIENYDELEKLKEVVSDGGSFEKSGKAQMTIRAGGYYEGLSLHSRTYGWIKDKKRLQQVVKSYEYAIEQAEKISAKLYL